MATTVIGSLAINPLLTIQARGSGQLSFGPVAIPAGYYVLAVIYDLQQVSSVTAVFSVAPQLAPDGVTFQDIGAQGLDLSKSGFVLQNGVLTRNASDSLGPGPIRATGIHILLPFTHLTTRQVQGTLTCSEAVTSGVTLFAY